MKDELSPTARMGNPCRRDRELTVRIAITVRSDAGREMLDAYWNAVQAKLAAVWPDGVTIKEGPSVWDDEIADNDVNELVQEVTLCYATAPWRLDVPAT
jgi:hypothetical protein